MKVTRNMKSEVFCVLFRVHQFPWGSGNVLFFCATLIRRLRKYNATNIFPHSVLVETQNVVSTTSLSFSQQIDESLSSKIQRRLKKLFFFFEKKLIASSFSYGHENAVSTKQSKKLREETEIFLRNVRKWTKNFLKNTIRLRMFLWTRRRQFW